MRETHHFFPDFGKVVQLHEFSRKAAAMLSEQAQRGEVGSKGLNTSRDAECRMQKLARQINREIRNRNMNQRLTFSHQLVIFLKLS